MLSVDEALARILAAVGEPTPPEAVPLMRAFGRTLAAPLVARRTQPPFAASAMDGYAVRAEDAALPGARLRVVGEAPAGRAFPGRVGPGDAVRIFTGGPLPEGADTVLMQENVDAEGGLVVPRQAEPAGRYVRPAGLDFRAGDELLPAGRRLDPRAVALAAAMGHAELPVRGRPRIGLLATGDELVRPGEPAGPDQIVASNTYAVAGMVEAAGGAAADLGLVADEFSALEAAFAGAEGAGLDVLVTLGGASVGERDLVQSALSRRGMALGFWRIAMRPGKPLLFGRLGGLLILGLPGNPVSSIVTARLFLVPLLRALQGDSRAGADPSEPAVLARDLPANDARQDYLRATLERRPDALPLVAPFARQDSSMMSALASADALLVRPPHAAPAAAGEPCRIVRL